MVTIHDPTIAYSTLVSRRRQLRASDDVDRFRLGLHGLNCGPASTSDRDATIGASAWALKAEQIEHTVQIIGLAGGLLADLGFRVCPIGADADRPRPSLVVWVCGDETEADEYHQLAAIGVPGLSIGSCVEGLESWGFIESADVEDWDVFTRLFVANVAALTQEGAPNQRRESAS